MRSMLSLLRASEISFPGEKVMEEAKEFTKQYLNQVLGGLGDVTDVDQCLLREVNTGHFFKILGGECNTHSSQPPNLLTFYKIEGKKNKKKVHNNCY